MSAATAVDPIQAPEGQGQVIDHLRRVDPQVPGDRRQVSRGMSWEIPPVLAWQFSRREYVTPDRCPRCRTTGPGGPPTPRREADRWSRQQRGVSGPGSLPTRSPQTQETLCPSLASAR
jgi:hypothetical protein